MDLYRFCRFHHRLDLQLFPPEVCELVLRAPMQSDEGSEALTDLVNELRYEASRRELSVFATHSAAEAADHLIDQVA